MDSEKRSAMNHHVRALDGLRAASILIVLAAHLLPIGPKPWALNESLGAMGMTLFFALSGFLITTNLMRGQGPVDFFVRRLARILPLVYAYIFFVYVAVEYDPAKLVVDLAFVENYAQKYLDGLNGHLWSLCVEVHFYIAIGLTVAVFGRRALWIVVPACIAVTALRIFDGTVTDIRTHLRIDEILAGACVAIAFSRSQRRDRYDSHHLAFAVAVWIAASMWFTGPLQYFRPYSSALVLWVALQLRAGSMLTILESASARYIANISYALYVIHPITAHGWMNEGSTFVRYAFKRPISFALTFLLAHISTFYYEARWTELAKRFLNRPKPVERPTSP
jgi:peptidoglycan/LPS O-acetylase OafA/YrhL